MSEEKHFFDVAIIGSGIGDQPWQQFWLVRAYRFWSLRLAFIPSLPLVNR